MFRHRGSESGGRIILTSGLGGEVLIDGEIDASSEFGQGGQVKIEGVIELAENTVIDVTGNSSGGNVLVGGDWGGTYEELRVLDTPNKMHQ